MKLRRSSITMIRSNRTALISAALRHTRDAEHLLEDGPYRSVDQAWHLAGFGPECARKACLGERWADRSVGHSFGDDVLEIALALDAWALRHRAREWRVRWPVLGEWRPAHRYERTGSRCAEQTESLVDAARETVDAVVADLWTRGQLSREVFECQ